MRDNQNLLYVLMRLALGLSAEKREKPTGARLMPVPVRVRVFSVRDQQGRQP